MTEGTLLVGSTEKGRELLQKLLPAQMSASCAIAQSGSEARRIMDTTTLSLVIINTPLSDESGIELSIEAARATMAGVLLIVRAEVADSVALRVEAAGVMVVSKPVARPLFDQALHLTMTARNRMMWLQNQNVKLQIKIQEIRLVDRAKCILIQTLGMTEEQAHRHIEKRAMDTRQTKVQVAKNILATYEN